MSIFKSAEQRANEAREEQAKRDGQTSTISAAFRGADSNARLMAFANVYATGGRLDSPMWGFDSENAEKALRGFVQLMENMS
jgi:hypothetical protein